MTERGRREYTAGMHASYEQADKRERGKLLTEYCRTRHHPPPPGNTYF